MYIYELTIPGPAGPNRVLLRHTRRFTTKSFVALVARRLHEALVDQPSTTTFADVVGPTLNGLVSGDGFVQVEFAACAFINGAFTLHSLRGPAEVPGSAVLNELAVQVQRIDRGDRSGVPSMITPTGWGRGERDATGVALYDAMTPEQQAFADEVVCDATSNGVTLALEAIKTFSKSLPPGARAHVLRLVERVNTERDTLLETYNQLMLEAAAGLRQQAAARPALSLVPPHPDD